MFSHTNVEKSTSYKTEGLDENIIFSIEGAIFLLCNVIGLFIFPSQQNFKYDGEQKYLICLLWFVLWYVFVDKKF